jgi:4-amino-4-deoxy-L-arabinose transferase-like glycosyltransferase
MWAGVAGFLVRYPQYRDSGLDQVDSNEFNRYIRNVKNVSPLELLAASRSFMILGHALILLASFVYASRLIGLLPAFISFLLLAFEPFHIALSRLLHLDGMLSNLLILSLLAFLYYIESRRLIDLAMSAIAAGLGLLTKLPAVLIVPVVGILIVYACWKDMEGQPGWTIFRLILPVTRIAVTWSLVALFTFVALWPAMWVRPVQTISSVLIQGAGHLEADADSLSQRMAGQQDNDLSVNKWYFYPLSYLFRSTPVVLLDWSQHGRS